MQKTSLEDLNFKIVENMMQNLSDFLPNLVTGILFIIFCWLLLKLTLFITGRMLRICKVDTFINKLKGEVFKSSTIEFEASKFILLFVKFFLIFIFILIGSDLLGLERLSFEIGKILSYLPQFFSGLLILIFGIYLGVQAKKFLVNTMNAMGLMGAKMAGQFVFIIILMFVLITSLNHMNINTDFITNNISIIIGSFFAALALAFGIGSKNVVEKIFYVFYTRRLFNIGDKIAIDDAEGIIIAIDNLTLTAMVNNQKMIFPIKDVINSRIKVINS